jgi:predicted RNA binding protein YcfA (HicA-like mRNA interferase family)/predicted RNase H-like HicB family nuclease
VADEVKVGLGIKRLETAGWLLVATRASHRQFKHPIRPGRVSVAGKPSDELAPGTLRSISKQHFQTVSSSPSMTRTDAVVIEQAGAGISAYVPDLPGCVAAASSREAVLVEIRAAIQFHLEGLASDGFVAPASSSSVEMVSV